MSEYTYDITSLQPDCQYRAIGEQLFTLQPADPNFNIIQGAYFNGDKFYIATVKRDDGGYESVRIQVADKNGSLIALSEPLALDHANNITYKPGRGLIVTHCQSPDKHFNRYSVVDIDTLTITETADLAFPFFAMAYSPERDMFASAEWGGETVDICDGDMKQLKSVGVEQPGSLSQGVFCDENAIYFIRSSRGGYGSEIRIYDWECSLIRRIPVMLDGRTEPENINLTGGKSYIICNSRSGALFYTLRYEIAD